MTEEIKRIIPKHLSASALKLARKSLIDYYSRYLAKHPREQQSLPMAFGSAFDVKVKAEINDILKVDRNLKYEEELERCIQEKHHLEPALKGAEVLFERYKQCGAFGQLMVWLRQATNIELENRRNFNLLSTGAIVQEVPDLVADFDQHKMSVVHDWKVNGYNGTGSTTPQKGFIHLYDCCGRNARGTGKPHKDAYLEGFVLGGLYEAGGEINDTEWKDQLRTYSYNRTYSDNVFLSVDQFCGAPTHLRLAQHRGFLSDDEGELVKEYVNLWQLIRDPHFFKDITITESKALEEKLQKQKVMFDKPENDWMRHVL